MNEHFQRQSGRWNRRGIRSLGCLDFLDFLEGAFAGQDHKLAAQLSRKLHSRRARDGHLRGGVDGKIRREMTDEPADAHVLHDGGIHPGRDDRPEVLLRVQEFIGKDESVECDVSLHAAEMQEFHEPGQIGLGKIVGAHPGVETFQAEVNGIGAIFHRSLGALPISRRSQKFRIGGLQRGRPGGRADRISACLGWSSRAGPALGEWMLLDGAHSRGIHARSSMPSPRGRSFIKSALSGYFPQP